MRPPKSVKIGARRYSIEIDDAATRTRAFDEGTPGYGYTLLVDQKILLSPGLAPDLLAETVLHEVLHAIVDAAGLGDELVDKGTEAKLDEEDIVRRMAPVLLSVLRENLRLVDWLCVR